MKRYWYSTFLAASLAAVIAVEYVPGAVRKLTPWYEAGAMERETDEGAAKKPDIGADRTVERGKCLSGIPGKAGSK